MTIWVEVAGVGTPDSRRSVHCQNSYPIIQLLSVCSSKKRMKVNRTNEYHSALVDPHAANLLSVATFHGHA